ncbi:MAG: DCC1-like thiol-disulfide oxidoreductase family protein [Planctomycetota bacterium]
MKHVTVLYDPTCGFCVSCRQWLSKQPKWIEMHFVPQGSSRAKRLFPTLTCRADDQGRPDELVVVDDRGQVYRDDKAWVICFYALRDFRGLSMKLARPGMAKLARRAYTLISGNRRAISTLIGADRKAVRMLEEAEDDPGCHNALCALKQAKARVAEDVA